MTNYDELVKNPPEIWLQSYDDTTALDQDRLWCEDKVWPDHEDDHEPVKYVRADLFEDLQRQLAEKDEALREADAFDIVAAWHEKNAAQFKQIANDDPRTGQLDRLKAAEAAKHHAGSAASLRIKANDIRRAYYAAIVAKQEKSE